MFDEWLSERVAEAFELSAETAANLRRALTEQIDAYLEDKRELSNRPESPVVRHESRRPSEKSRAVSGANPRVIGGGEAGRRRSVDEDTN